MLSLLEVDFLGSGELGDDRLIVLEIFESDSLADRPIERMLPLSESRGATVGPRAFEGVTKVAAVWEGIVDRGWLLRVDSTEGRLVAVGKEVVDAVVGDNSSGVDDKVVLSVSSFGTALI